MKGDDCNAWSAAIHETKDEMLERWIQCDDDDCEAEWTCGSSSIMSIDAVLIVAIGIEVIVDGASYEAVHTAKSLLLVCVLARREITGRLLVAVCTLLKMTLRAYASVLRRISSTGVVLHRLGRMGLLTVDARGHESRRGACCGTEARRSAHAVTITRLSCVRAHRGMVSGIAPDTQGVLGEADTDTSLVTVVQLYTIQLVKCMRGISNVLVLDETHGSVLLRTEAKSLKSSAFGKQRLQLVLASVDGQISHVQGVARRVLISRISRRIIMLQVQIPARIISIWSYSRTSGGSLQWW